MKTLWWGILGCGMVVVAASVTANARDVRAWEDTITIPTYRMGPEDVNPRFYDLEGKLYYPYTEQEHLTTIKEDKVHKALYLENEYIKLICLPELGGKIYSVLDKTTGKEMFYRNHVIKPGLIAMRGAWISGGIEWNAGPTGHGVASYSPVDATYVKNNDGSATLVIGDTEHSTRTRWTVWLTLHPKRSYLDERIRIENATDSVQTFYFWNNTAFPCNKGTRFIYPMTLGTDHGGTNFFNWPIDDGKDLTWLKNYDRPTSIFAYQCAFDFFGAYEVDADQGIVQVANHHELIGKKAWTWGNSDDGLVSQSRLTDEDGPYIEVQSGPLETQADFGLLGPQQSIEWQEWWYPIHGLGQGFEYATKDVAVQTVWSTRGGANVLQVRLLTTGVVPRLTCTVIPEGVPSDGELEISSLEVSKVTPEEPVVFDVDLAEYGAATIEVEDDSGHLLASFQSPLPIPVKTPPEPSQPSEATAAEALVLAGINAEKQNNRNVAREKYEAALQHDPGNAEALVGLAVLDIESAQYGPARDRLEKALARNPEHGMAWYYLGVTWLGEDWQRGADPACLDAALNAAHWAAQSLDTSALGHDLLGRVYMRKGNHAEALRAFEEASARSVDGSSREHVMIARFAAGQVEGAVDGAKELLHEDPLRIVPRVIMAAAEEEKWSHVAEEIVETSGEDTFAILEAAYALIELGQGELALHLLDSTCSVANSPLYDAALPRILMAFLRRGASTFDSFQLDLYIAAREPVDYVFPSRPECLPVLRYAATQDPDTYANPRACSYSEGLIPVGNPGRFPLYLGNLYAGLGRLDEAAAAWESAVALDDALSVAHRNLGMHAWKKENDLEKAAAHYEKALAARPNDQALYRDLANILIAQGRRPEAIALLERSPQEPSRRGDLTTLLAQTYLDVKNYDAPLALLEGKSFSNWEGNATTWNIFHRARIERGKLRLDANDAQGALDDFEASLSYPESLGVGRPADPEEAESYYWKGRALAALNRPDEARNAWQTGATGREGSPSQNEHRQLAQEALKAL